MVKGGAHSQAGTESEGATGQSVGCGADSRAKALIDPTAMLRLAPVAMFCFDADGTCTFVNERWSEMTGLRFDEALGDGWRRAVHPEDLDRVLRELQESLAGRRPGRVECRLLGPAGLVYVLAEGVPEERDGVLVAYVGTVTDVSALESVRFALQASERRWRSLVEEAPVHVLILDGEGRIRFLNRPAKGYTLEQQLGSSCFDWILPDYHDEVARTHAHVWATGEPVEIEVPARAGDGETRWYRCRCNRLAAADGSHEMLVIGTDITERRRAEEDVRRAEQRWRLLLDNAPDYVSLIDSNRRVAFVNRVYPGVRREDVVGSCFLDWVAPERRDEVDAAYERAKQKGQTEEVQVAFVLPDGSAPLFRTRAGALEMPDGERMVMVISTDVTEKARVEEDLQRANEALARNGAALARTVAALNQEIDQRGRMEQELRRSRQRLQGLSRRLISVQEEERRRMAREIHDELGQSLTGIRLELHGLVTRLDPQRTDLMERADRIRNVVDETIRNVREIAGELRPGALDDLGLLAALEWQTETFERRSGLSCSLDAEGELELRGIVAISVFRIVQEALTNVARHAHANHVEIELASRNGRLTLVVRDDGRGIRPAEAVSTRSLGLTGIRERANLCGGRVRIRGSDEGTELRVVIPLPEGVGETGGRPTAPMNRRKQRNGSRTTP